MDTADLIVEYSEGDFADAYRRLLPKGQYWQDTDNVELTHTICGIARDFKQTHDDIELSLLSEFKEPLFGWKIQDYQRLLDEVGAKGLVYDDIAIPNVIKIDLADPYSDDNAAAFEAFENVRLPHTECYWIYPLAGRAQFLCRTAITWQLKLGETE
ncbi:hypothetical protein [uncultured Vibrio sp.]|uniref:hypothetical protein n=1 Tax=uncultured Vibrio sp. TaxID=114054 RepID=UPI002612B220|nr:hypothetical protein [uncultured Vibrio sp.]